MSADEGDFLKRWSRRKREAALARPEGQVVREAAPDLPSVDSLTFESDFSQFLRAGVEESVKRAALKKLLRDPRFNVMDGLDTYIDDYSKDDPIPDEMLRNLEHARELLLGPQKEEAAREAAREDAEGKAAGEKPAVEDDDPARR